MREEKNELVKQYKHEGIAVKIGDYVNPASLLSAFQGIDVLYFVSVGDDDQQAQLHQNVVEAAQRAHVRHIIYTSSVWRNETDSPLGNASWFVSTNGRQDQSIWHYLHAIEA